MDKTTSICILCGDPFTYEVKLRRTGLSKNPNQFVFRKVCDACRRLKAIETSKRWKEQNGLRPVKKKKNEVKLDGLAQATHEEIAKALKITTRAVCDLERKVLFKIRNIPQLKELWDTFKSDGVTVSPGELFKGGLLGGREGIELLEYQMAVVDWWALHDEIVANGDAAHAEECLSEIQKFQQTIVDTIANM